MKAVALCVLALLSLAAVPAVRAADTPSLNLDLEHGQDLKIDARHVPLGQLLETLGQQLKFTIDFSPLADRAALVNGKFEGSLDEVLSQVLSNANYVLQQAPNSATRVVVLATSKPAGSTVAAAAANQPLDVKIKAPEQPASPAAQAARPGAAAATAFASAASSPGTPPSVVSKLLSSQANQLLPVDPNAAPASTSGAQSMGVMTHIAAANVQALVSALNAACVGSGCGH